MSETLFTLLGVAQWSCPRSPLTVSSQAACLLGSVSNWRFGGLLLWCWLRDRGVLLRTAVDYARVFPFFVTEDNCTLGRQRSPCVALRVLR